jgi:hypothetical protein
MPDLHYLASEEAPPNRDLDAGGQMTSPPLSFSRREEPHQANYDAATGAAEEGKTELHLGTLDAPSDRCSALLSPSLRPNPTT